MKSSMNIAFQLSKWGVLAGLLLLVSCQPFRNLNEAQDIYNKTEKEYKAEQFDQSTEAGDYRAAFEKAYEKANAALRDKEQLKEENLLADAYLVKALCAFRLDKYEEAESSAGEAQDEYFYLRSQNKPYEVSKMQSAQLLLPQIKVERLGQELKRFHAPGDIGYKQALEYHLEHLFDPESLEGAKMDKALQKLEELKSEAGFSDSLLITLINTQMTALKVWSDGLDYLRQSALGLPEEERERAREYRYNERRNSLIPVKERLLEELSAQLEGGDSHDMVRHWDSVI